MSIFPVYDLDRAAQIFKPPSPRGSRTPCAYVPFTDARAPYTVFRCVQRPLHSTL